MQIARVNGFLFVCSVFAGKITWPRQNRRKTLLDCRVTLKKRGDVISLAEKDLATKGGKGVP